LYLYRDNWIDSGKTTQTKGRDLEEYYRDPCNVLFFHPWDFLCFDYWLNIIGIVDASDIIGFSHIMGHYHQRSDFSCVLFS